MGEARCAWAMYVHDDSRASRAHEEGRQGRVMARQAAAPRPRQGVCRGGGLPMLLSAACELLLAVCLPCRSLAVGLPRCMRRCR